MKKLFVSMITIVLSGFLLGSGLFVHNTKASADSNLEDFPQISAKISLDKEKGTVRSSVAFSVEGLKPKQPVKLIWQTVKGSYQLEGLYSFIKPQYEEKELTLLAKWSDADGKWAGSFEVPEGFGGDHTIYIRQNGKKVAQTNFFVAPTFKMSPESGPVGSEITITAEGIGWTDMESNWQLTYDNKMTGLISAVSTEGKATAKIRAAGPVGKHTITVWHGYLGMPYINHQQAPTSYLPVPTFTFNVTDEKPIAENLVEAIPASAAGGGVEMPALQNRPGVEVNLSKSSGTVGEPTELRAQGLPANQTVDLVWNTMEGSRVTTAGFAEKTVSLGKATTDENGELDYPFSIPDDLGGIPHRIDLKIGGQVYGQAYLSITPSIVSVSPSLGPAGTEVSIEIKGVGWTEYDNAYYLTYDNAYTGYMCGFNTHGTVKFTIIASGEPGYHIIDLYPGIYRGQKTKPDIYVAPQLTYEQDHPGSKIPAIRLGFEVTE